MWDEGGVTHSCRICEKKRSIPEYCLKKKNGHEVSCVARVCHGPPYVGMIATSIVRALAALSAVLGVFMFRAGHVTPENTCALSLFFFCRSTCVANPTHVMFLTSCLEKTERLRMWVPAEPRTKAGFRGTTSQMTLPLVYMTMMTINGWRT